MTSFTTPLRIEFEGDGTWTLTEEFIFFLGEGARHWQLKIPIGFNTDFASIPRIFWAVLPPAGKYGKAAVVHDYLYRNYTFSRAVADAIFLEGMYVLEVPYLTRMIMYLAVRCFGWASFNKQIPER